MQGQYDRCRGSLIGAGAVGQAGRAVEFKTEGAETPSGRELRGGKWAVPIAPGSSRGRANREVGFKEGDGAHKHPTAEGPLAI